MTEENINTLLQMEVEGLRYQMHQAGTVMKDLLEKIRKLEQHVDDILGETDSNGRPIPRAVAFAEEIHPIDQTIESLITQDDRGA